MSRRLDMHRLWQIADEHGINLGALARRAGLHGPDRDRFLQAATGLGDLSAPQLVALAETLEVTVEELLTDHPPTGPGGRSGHERPLSDRFALAAALLDFPDSSLATLIEAFGWTPARLDRAVAGLHRTLEASGLTVHRGHRRLTLTGTDLALPDHARQRLTEKRAEQALDPEHTPHLVVAIRAHALGPYPGPPWTPWAIADDLVRQRAAAPIDRRHPGRPVRLRPHPDLLFGLHLIPRPDPYTPREDDPP